MIIIIPFQKQAEKTKVTVNFNPSKGKAKIELLISSYLPVIKPYIKQNKLIITHILFILKYIIKK